MSLVKQLTPEVVKCDIRVWGGPGSGKTTHCCEIIRGYGVDPTAIAALTLRRSMANDLKRKLIRTGVADSTEDLPYTTTMHGVIRRWFVFPRENSIYGDKSENLPNLQVEFFADRKIPFSENGEEVFKTIPEKLGNLFLAIRTWIIHTMHEPKDWGRSPIAKEFIHHGGNHSLFKRLWNEYEEFKEAYGVWDFDDLIIAALKADTAPPVKLLFVDEAQDNSLAMHNIIAKWSRKIPVVIVAGDPNQSIYGFLGADPSLFWNYTAARQDIQLPKCYRIPETTWKIAKNILAVSKHPIPNFSFSKDSGIIRRIGSHKLPDILKRHTWPAFHLVRANFMRERIAELLIENGRPFKGYGSGWTDNDFNLYNAILEIRKHAKESFQSEKLIPLPYLKRLAEVFPKKFFNCKKKEITENEYAWQDIHSILKPHLISQLFGPDPFANALKSGLSETQRLKVTQALRYNDKRLTEADLHLIMTIHEAKGLERESTFLYSEWTRKIKLERDFREEARVWFVATTRHKSMLIIVDGLFSDIPACEPCPFLEVNHD